MSHEGHYTEYTPRFKEKVVLEYQKGVRGRGYQALAARFKIDGGHNLVKAWVQAYDGTTASLAKHHGGAVEMALDQGQREQLVNSFVESRVQQACIRAFLTSWPTSRPRQARL